MKLRLRSFESKETLKLEAPNSCTLRQLKLILSQNLPDSPSPDSIRLSLNRKDELRSTSPEDEDSLQVLGIAGGDLVFFTFDPNSKQNSLPVSMTASGMYSNSQIILPLKPDFDTSKPDSEVSMNLNTQNTLSESQNSESVILDSLKRKTLDTDSQGEGDKDYMEVDDDGDGDGDGDGDDDSYNNDGHSDEVVEKSFSVPGFLRKVFMEEMGGDSGHHHKLTVIAIHAVLLESGLVGFDPNSNMEIIGFQLRNEWPSSCFRLSLFYTLPEIVTGDRRGSIDSIVLKFQSLGKFINVYGSLGNVPGRTVTHCLRLNEDQLVPFLNAVWANCGVTESITGNDGGIFSTSPEKELFKFWRNVKDNLALPLLIDLCEMAGLELPPCFIRLPTDLKLKILESLPGVEVAKVSCVCSELRYLASSDDLWKLKFTEQFGNEKIEAHESWKKTFSRVWERQKSRKLESRARTSPGWPAPGRRFRHPNPFVVPRAPRIIGGDYDIWPAFGDDLHTRLHNPANHWMRTFSPPCNLGGSSNRNFV